MTSTILPAGASSASRGEKPRVPSDGTPHPAAADHSPKPTGRKGITDRPNPILLLPAVALYALFAIVPLAVALWLSFTSWDAISDPEWVGLENWTRILGGDNFRNGLMLSLQVIVVSWLVQTPISLLLGVFTAGHQKYRAVLAALYFIPLILSSAATALAFKAILDPNFGLGATPGLELLRQDWLGNPQLIFVTVVFLIAWQFVPFHALLYQAGVRQIPRTLYEAAELDGAGRLQTFWYVTLPQLRHTIVTSSTIMLVGSLTYFDVIFVLTGGVPGYGIRILPIDMYLTGFAANDMGGASVLAMVLVVVGLLIALGITRVSGFSRMKSDQEGA
ncbi:carbohydrate ABC transporter permease [Pseudoclavibacter sp. RFBA6]|uniref:carbohydrate ABC transporter permease n=1 Tax=Pseudoclavibacter sp. RFBA6 TaxID=2080573 RepID=UPI000CE7E564|nr:sugar ABC transporter permease [Pseudoclavibacter sp. RFBA6]PPG42145.1 ABC transporter [Pseudoclavibacter sp. RFBA6]